jgi:adenylate cyclase
LSYKRDRLFTDVFIISYWLVIINLLSVVAIYSIEAFLEISEAQVNYETNEMTDYFTSPKQYVEASLFGLFFGIWFIAVDRLSLRWRLDRLSFSKLILLKSGIYFLGFIIIVFLIYTVQQIFGFYTDEIWNYTYGRKMMTMVAVILVGIILFIFLLNFIVQSITTMGHYNIARFLTGKYRTPVVEDRTFLFMDLRDSTGHAERLGYVLYSEMIKDCIYDINMLLTKYQAEVYQYVGDEIVLSWETNIAVNNLNFVRIFFAFRDRLQNRAKHYNEKYNTIPVFKAGCNSGRVTATEIGVVNRAIGFHGDVLNTAARLEGICNQMEQDFLISDSLHGEITALYGDMYRFPYKIISLGKHELRGKHEKVEVFAVESES